MASERPQPAPAQPLRRSVAANGLIHSVTEWGAPDPRATALLVHGYMDAAATWDHVAPVLAASGLRVLAPDLRGFGDGPRVPPGGYYHFPDYVMDLAELVDALVRPEAPLFVVGHSMGGTLSTLYAGAFPERVARLAIIEGAGPPDNEHDHAPERMRRWIEEVRAVRARPERVMASREDAFRRLAINHPRVAPEVLHAQLHALARRPDGEREGEGGGGRLVWKADPLHGTRSPMPFFAESWKAFARRVTCPALFVSGGPAGWHPPDEEARLAAFAHLERVEIEDAGHMIHWTRPAQLVRALLDFLA